MFFVFGVGVSIIVEPKTNLHWKVQVESLKGVEVAQEMEPPAKTPVRT